jgi:hypothetical protein
MLKDHAPPSSFQQGPHAGGNGVNVGGPNALYFPSITARIARSDLPSACMAITSRVMFRQMSQVAP